MFRVESYTKGLISGYWRYGDILEDVSYDIPRTYISPNVNTDMFVVQNLKFGSLIECTNITEFDEKFDWVIRDSNEKNFNYNLYGRSLIYILDTSLSISEKVGFRSAEEDIFYHGFFENPSIKLIALTKLLDDDGGVELYNGHSTPTGATDFGAIYVFSSHLYYRFRRNSKYIVCFGLGEPFK